jgi:hypothetical protein
MHPVLCVPDTGAVMRPHLLTLFVPLLLGIAFVPGCRGAERRPGTRFRGDSGATIGRDLNSLPPGRTAGPTGLGVDLVEYIRYE